MEPCRETGKRMRLISPDDFARNADGATENMANFLDQRSAAHTDHATRNLPNGPSCTQCTGAPSALELVP